VSELTAADISIFEQAVGQTTTPAPDSTTLTEVKVTDGQRRNLIMNLETYSLSVTVRLSYNLINFPTYTGSSLSSAVETAVKSSASSNVFGSTLLAIAVTNGANNLLEVIIYSVNTETSVTGETESNSNGSSGNSLTVGAISAIAVCLGSAFMFVVVFIVYWFCFLSSSSAWWQPSAEEERKGRDIVVVSGSSEVVL
jgi:hypothetical protein